MFLPLGNRTIFTIAISFITYLKRENGGDQVNSLTSPPGIIKASLKSKTFSEQQNTYYFIS